MAGVDSDCGMKKPSYCPLPSKFFCSRLRSASTAGRAPPPGEGVAGAGEGKPKLFWTFALPALFCEGTPACPESPSDQLTAVTGEGDSAGGKNICTGGGARTGSDATVMVVGVVAGGAAAANGVPPELSAPQVRNCRLSFFSSPSVACFPAEFAAASSRTELTLLKKLSRKASHAPPCSVP